LNKENTESGVRELDHGMSTKAGETQPRTASNADFDKHTTYPEHCAKAGSISKAIESPDSVEMNGVLRDEAKDRADLQRYGTRRCAKVAEDVLESNR